MAGAVEPRRCGQYRRRGYVLDVFTPDGKKFTGSWGPYGTYDMDIRWINKDDVPLLKDFEPIGPLPNLLKNSKAKADTVQSAKP